MELIQLHGEGREAVHLRGGKLDSRALVQGAVLLKITKTNEATQTNGEKKFFVRYLSPPGVSWPVGGRSSIVAGCRESRPHCRVLENERPPRCHPARGEAGVHF